MFSRFNVNPKILYLKQFSENQRRSKGVQVGYMCPRTQIGRDLRGAKLRMEIIKLNNLSNKRGERWRVGVREI